MIDWSAFLVVVASSLVTASILVVLFSLALRVGDGSERWRRPASVLLFVLCGLLVATGIVVIVPAVDLFGL